MKIKISELQVELSAEELTEAIIRYINYEEDNRLLEPTSFDLCHISHESTTDKISVLFGEKLSNG